MPGDWLAAVRPPPQRLENPNKSGAKSGGILRTLNTAEAERERADPFKAGSALSLPQQRGQEAGEGEGK